MNKGNIITALIILALLLAGYWYATLPNKEGPGLSSAPGIQGEIHTLGEKNQEFLKLLVNLKSLKLDTSIFGNPLFTGLKDFGVKLEPEARGRKNPFAPLPGTSKDENERIR